MIERAAVVAVAVAAIVFLGAGLTAARAEDELFRLGFGDPDVERAERLERTAGRLTPGERRVLLLANVRLRGGDAPGALALAKGAVRREPDNAEAWLGLARAAREADPALARTARQRLRELVPPVPAP